MKNAISDGKVLSLTAPTGGVTSGVSVLIGALFVVALHDAVQGAEFQGAAEGHMSHNKTASDGGASAGDIAYWDDTAKKITATKSTNTAVGVFTATAGDADTTAAFSWPLTGAGIGTNFEGRIDALENP